MQTLIALALLGQISCVGDCHNDRAVTVDDLILGVNVVLGEADVAECPAILCRRMGEPQVPCIVIAVFNSLSGACEEDRP
jgi:hypothetical protein